ncbi:MAG: UDP-N-acetylmuramoyl-L-alanine--D-glutamate ligase [Kineosporiaceae bacterium]
MPPAISWADVAAIAAGGGNVGVYGLGREGTANVRACLARGVRPVLVDDAPTGDVEGLPVVPTAEGGLDLLRGCALVVKTPGISRYAPPVRALREAGVPVRGGVGLWLAERAAAGDAGRVVAITGTKGKSTTTAIAAHLGRGLGLDVAAVGNIGAPPHDPDAAASPDLWVLEVSSYQAADVEVGPHVVGVTSLAPDHLPWHEGSVERYYADKLSLARADGVRRVIANGDSALLRARPELAGDAVTWVGLDTDASWVDDLQVLGAHNRRNALIARALLQAAGVPGADDDAALAAAARGFGGLESRLQRVATVDGVDFVDDGLSTNVLPTLAAVEAFAERRVALIVGGQSRGIDYEPLATGLRARTQELLLLATPDNGPDILAAYERAGGGGPLVTARAVGSLAEAVAEGFAWARPSGVVLLSPAAPSFGLFRDYRDRGAAFAAAAHGCG